MVIQQTEYQQRRQTVLSKIASGVGVFRSAPVAVMHNDVEYNFRQDSNFYYLTGFNEPEAVAVFAPNHSEHQFILFVRPKDPEKETWSGRRVGVDLAKTLYGADAVYPINELDEKLPEYLTTGETIYYGLGRDKPFDEVLLRHYRQLLGTYPKRGTGPVAIADPAPLMGPIRLIKSAAELAAMRQAIAITVEAHHLARDLAKPGSYEYEIQAEMERLFRLRGGDGPAYPSIVASGSNACILHYTENTRQMQAEDLLLIDAGCAYGYYNADITRTFPVSGRFTVKQQAIYELVLAAQKAAIAQVQPGNTFNQVHDAAVRVLVTGLVELGLLQGDIDTLITEEPEPEKQKYKPFYMHRTSHWLGLDVHDLGVYRHNPETWATFQPGQVLTVEPGIYIGPEIQLTEEQPAVPECWRGIGIRIEDDVLVTATGHEVLTCDVPKEVAEITR